MSVATLILGESGSGKSTSLRNLDPKKTLLIQCIKKSLPFRSEGWSLRTKDNPTGNIIRTDDTAKIEQIMRKSKHEIIVIDDFQSTLVNELMRRTTEHSYQKFTDIGKNVWSTFNTAGDLAENRRVYILAHTQTGDDGFVRMKTVGKMVDQTLVPEGFFTIVLRTHVTNGNHLFSTQSNGMDCAKSPIGMFEDQLIDNDVNEVDKSITAFYQI